MFLTVHAAAAVALAQQTTSPALAFAIGFSSHFLVDAIPHGDENLVAGDDHRKMVKKIIAVALVDVAIMAVTFAALGDAGIIEFSPSLLAAAFGGLLPDALQIPAIVWPDAAPRALKQYRRTHENIHNLTPYNIGIRWGLLVQGYTLTFVVLSLI